MIKFNKSFINDEDGLSQKDFLVIIFANVFIGIILFATYSWAIGKDIQGLLQIIDAMAGVIMTIIGGIFGVNAVQQFRKKDLIDNENLYQDQNDDAPV